MLRPYRRWDNEAAYSDRNPVEETRLKRITIILLAVLLVLLGVALFLYMSRAVLPAI